MTTNATIIDDALSLLGVLADGETASAEDASRALRVLNQMMSGWEVDGLQLGYFAQSSATDTCPIPDWAEKGVVGALAVDLAPYFERAITPMIAQNAKDGIETILRRLISLKMRGADMTHLGATNGRYNITTDLY